MREVPDIVATVSVDELSSIFDQTSIRGKPVY